MNFEDLIHGLLHEPDFSKRKYFPDKLAKLGDWNSTEYLGKLMNNENEPIALRIECAESLGKQGDPRAIEYLANAIQNSDKELRRTSLWSLGQIGTENTVGLIMQLVDDPEFMIQKWVVKSLGRIRSPWGLKHLNSVVENYFELYNQHLHLILKAVIDQIDYADSETLHQWLDRTYLYFENTQITIVQKNCLLLQQEILSRGLVGDEKFLRTQLNSISEEDNIVRPHLIRLLGYVLFDTTLEKLPITEDVIVALSIRGNTDFLVQILKNHKEYDFKIISCVLENLNVDYDCSEFLQSDYDDIRFAALNYSARFGLHQNLILEAIKEGKRINYLLNLLQYIPIRSFDLIKQFGMQGSKPHRQSIIQVLKDINYKKHKSVLDDALDLLSQISQADRIWHIRRDARILRQKLLLL